MNPQYWQAIAAFVVACAALYGVVTAPLLRTLKAEISASEERMKGLVTGVKTELKEEMAAMELRLSDKLSSKLIDHGERITRLEERRFNG